MREIYKGALRHKFLASAFRLLAGLFAASPAFSAVWTETQQADWNDGLVSQTTWYPSTQLQLDWHGSTTGATVPSAASWLSGWDYRKAITINNASGGALSDYQVLVTSPVYNETGLVGSWHFEVGNSSADSSGNGNNGTINGGMTCGAGGKFGGGCTFDGTDDYMGLPSPPAAYFYPQTNGGFSVGAWIKTTQTTSAQIVGHASGSAWSYDSWKFYINYGSPGELNFYAVAQGGASYAVTMAKASAGVNDGNWHYVAVTKDTSGNWAMYVDSNSVAAASWNGNVQNNGYPMAIGAQKQIHNGLYTSYFNGMMDEVGIYNRALSAAEIQARYQAKAKPNYDDIRFTKTDGTTALPHWMESDGKFWVKVSGANSVPAGNSTIYAYYGNSSAVNASSGTDTVEFIEDFNRANGAVGNGWTTYQGSAEILDNSMHLVSGAYGLTAKPFSLSNGVAVTGKMKGEHTCGAASFQHIHLKADTTYGTAGVGFYAARGYETLNFVDGGPNASYSFTAGVWYNYEMDVAADYATQLYFWPVGGQKPASPAVSRGAYTPTAAGTNLRVATENCGVPNYYYDDIVVRKYNSTEPVAAVGSEEGGYLSTGTYKSNVLDAGAADAIITQTAWNPSGQPGGTAVIAAARASNTVFAAGDTAPAWTVLTNGANPGIYGRYIQYMSTFTTVELSTSPKLEDMALTYGFLGAPSGLSGTADSPGQITWNWTDNSSAPQEDGFKVYDALDSLKTSVGPGVVSWVESASLSPNTLYTRYVQSYIGGVIANSGSAGSYTLPAAPTDGNIPCDKAVSTPYNTPFFTFTNTAGFGAGGVQYFKYKWDADPSPGTFPDTWSGGNLTLSLTAPGTYYYLHLKAYNGDGFENSTTLTKGPYVSGVYIGAADTTETSGQFGGGLVKSSVTVTGSGNDADVRLAGLGSAGLAGWDYRKAITINNASGGALSDYQVLVSSPVFDETGLAGSWHFEEAAGTISGATADSSGNGNSGTLTNMAGPNGIISGGKFGNGASFDGGNDHITQSPASGFPAGSSARTVEAWVKLAGQGSSDGGSIICYGSGVNAQNFCLFLQTSGSISYLRFVGRSDDYNPGVGANLNDGAWHQVALVYDGSNLVAYTDGSAQWNTAKAINTVLGNLRIGASLWDTNYFNGTIDEFKIYSRALSAAEIQAHYQAKAKPNYHDIRFTKSDGTTLLPYWMEADGKFWVKVSGANSIPVGNSTIYAYYGSTSAASASNGASTFNFFDDFNRADGALGNGWGVVTGAGAVSLSGNRAVIGTSATQDGAADNPADGGVNGLAVASDFQLITQTNKYGGVYIRSTPTGANWQSYGYGWMLADNANLYIHDGGANVAGPLAFSITPDVWYNQEMLVLPDNSMEVRIWQKGTARPSAATISKAAFTPSANDGTGLRLLGGGNYSVNHAYYDDLRVRKYASADPGTSVGSEERSSYFPTGEFQSRVIDSGGTGRHWGDIGWRHNSPSGTSLQVRARTGNTAAPDGSWSSWSQYASSTGTPLTVPDGRYLQYASTFTTSISTVTPVLDEVAVTYGWLNTPSGLSGTADYPTQITWNWTDNSAAPQNEDGFKIYDQASAQKGTAGQDAVSWVESSGLSPNTQYTRYVQAYAPGLTANSVMASRYTLAATPIDADIPCDKAISTPYNTPFFTFTNNYGFGAGGVQYFKYKWDANPSETTFPDTWTGGELTLSLTAPGTSYYLHLKAYNVEDAANTATLTKGPYVSGIYAAAADTDETSGQFGGGLVKSSITVSGTGNAAYVRLTGSTTPFSVDGASGWNFRREINISNGGTYGLTDHQVFIPTTSFGGNWNTIRSSAQATMSDFRFTMSTAATSIPYWIDSDTAAPKGFWVKVSSIPTAGTKIYMYYGNSSAVSASSGPATFSFFDDFSGGSIDASKWTVDGAGGLTVANGEVQMTQAGGKIRSVATLSQPFIIETQHRSLIGTTGQGYAPVGTWASTVSGYGLQAYGSVGSSMYLFNNGGYSSIGPYAVNTDPRIYRMTSANGTVTFDALPLNRGASEWTYGGAYTVSSQQMRIGQRYDNTGTTEAQDERWDWLFIRKYAATEPAIGVIGGEEFPGYLPAGEFQSRVVDSGAAGRHWGDMGWRHISPPGTSIQMRARTGNTAAPDGSWSSWFPPAGWYTASTGTALTVPDGRYLQYRSTFTTSFSTATPVLDEVAVTYGWLNAPTGFSGTADSPTQITWNWTDNSAAPQNEDGFKIYDQGSSLKTTLGANAVSWVESPLSPNTLYTRYVQAYAPGITANSGNVGRYTLPVSPTAGNIACDKAISTPYNTPFFTFTNTSGFGAGGVQYFKYKWDADPSETTFPDTWSGGELTLSLAAPGTSYYLHIKAYNGEDAEGLATLTNGPYVSGIYASAGDTDETSGQFGGGLVKSSVTVTGTGNGAYVRLIGSSTSFSVDGASGWNFRREINITNAGTYGLTDYQVFIPTTSFGADWTAIRSSAQATMADFRFTMSTSTMSIPYWIESDTTSPKGFWVKVSSIPTAGTKIHIYYGNPSAASASSSYQSFWSVSNGDFESPGTLPEPVNGWAKAWTGNQAGYGVYTGPYGADASNPDRTPPQGTFALQENIGSWDWTGETWRYQDVTLPDRDGIRLEMWTASGNKQNNGYGSIDVIENAGAGTVHNIWPTSNGANIPWNLTTYDVSPYKGTTVRLKVLVGAGGGANGRNYNLFIDFVRVRKYAATEPAIGVIGSEEQSGYFPAGEFQSRVIDSGGTGRHWGDIGWRHNSPSGTSLQVRVRTGNTAAPDGTWSSWYQYASSTGTVLTVPDGRYLQYASTFTTSISTVTPVLDEVAVSYGWLNAPTGLAGTVDSPTQITWNWTDNSAAPQNEDGFKIYDPGSGLKTTLGANAVSWVESPLSPNTQYTRYVQAYAPGITANSGNVGRYTLPVAPTAGNMLCDKAVSTPYNMPFFTFTNASGFGAGGVQYFMYKWDTNASETTFPDTWSGGDLTLSIPDPGASYYLHIKAYNGADAANPTTLTKGPYLSGSYYAAVDADETSGQFGGGLVRSSVAVSGTGSAAYVRLVSSGAAFVVDGATGWNFRREINIGNAGASGLSDYQVFIPTTSFGSNWDAIRSSAQATMADFRFTMSTATTSIPYWIEEGTASPRGFWVKVSSIPTSGAKIHMYYGNPSAAAGSSGANTFEAFDLTGYSETDPGAKYTVTSNKVEVAGETNSSSGLSATVSGVGDFRHDSEIYRTTMSGDGGLHILLADAATNPAWNSWGTNNGVGFTLMNNSDNSYAMAEKYAAGTRTGSAGQIYLASGTSYYATLTRVSTTLTLSIYTDAARTIHRTGSPQILAGVPATAFTKLLVAQNDTGYAGARTYYIQNPRLLKYASVEPSIGVIGGEELAGYYPSGEFQSRAIDSGASGRHWGHIGWTHISSSGTAINMRVRTGNTATPDGSWSSWSGWTGVSTGTALAVPDARYLQYASTFTTLFSTATPVLDAVAVTYSWLNAPTGFSGTVNSPTQITWNWTDASAAPQNEDGFKIYDPGSGLKTTLGANAVSWIESPLSPNTLYTRYAQAYAPGITANSGNAAVYTLPATPTGGNIPCDKALSTPYNAAFFTFTNTAGFGAGGVQYFKYKWDTNPSETVFPDTWSGGDLTLGIPEPGASYYLHIKSYNAVDTANPATLTRGPYLSGAYYGAVDTDETAGQFGGWLVKSSVTVAGTGNAAYVRLSTNSAGSSFTVDGASGWSFRREINITNGGASGLSDYQVFIPTISFGSSWAAIRSSAQATMADFRFTLSTATESMSYWIESDTTAPKGIWVKVSSIPAAGTTIYMYYGNPSTTSVSNGAAVFDTFYDLRGLGGMPPGWQSAGTVNYSSSGISVNAWGYAATSASTYGNAADQILDAYIVMPPSASGSSHYAVGFANTAATSGAGKHVSHNLYNGGATAKFENSYSDSGYQGLAYGGRGVVSIRYNSGTAYYYSEYSSLGSYSTNVPGFTLNIGISNNQQEGTANTPAALSWIRLRKYAPAEPSVSSVGAENLSGYYPSGEFQSRVLDSGAPGRHWGYLGWNHVSPAGTVINMQVRTGNTATPDGTWSSWSGWSNASTGTALAVPDARYLQYRSSFTAPSTVTPVLDEVTASYSWLNAPTGFSGTADSPTQITWSWTDASAAPRNEDGFDIYDQGSNLKGSVGPNAVSWIESFGLNANTQYTRYAQAYLAGITANSASAGRYTLAPAPTGANITCDKAVSTVYDTPFFTFTNTAGFGAGTIQYLKYKWDTNPSETTFPDTWPSETLALSILAPGTSYYLHLKSYNAEDAGNPATLTKGPYVSGAYTGVADTDETSGQFGGGLVKSSVTVAGTGNAAYVRLTGSSTSFSVDGASGWNFRREINISNGGASGLSDYQVFIPTTSFGSSWAAIRSSAQVTMADFRFTMSTATTSLPYWIEEDTASPKGFWVKVSSIPTAGTKIHMYYGNPLAAYDNTLGGSNTFLFFDGADSLSPWTTLGGAPAQAGSEITVTDGSVTEGIRSNVQFGVNTALRSKEKKIGAGNELEGGGFGSGDGADLDGDVNRAYIYKHSNVGYVNNGNGAQTQTAITINDDNYHVYDIIRNGSANIIYRKDGGVVATHATNIPAADLYVRFSKRAGAGLEVFDWVLVRNYASVEPAIGVVGAEELTGYSQSGEFQSRAIDSGAKGARWGDLAWAHSTPQGTGIKMKVRTGDTPVPDGTWSAWYPLTGWYTASTGTPVTAPWAQYVQYQSSFTTVYSTASPQLAEADVWYSANTSSAPGLVSPADAVWLSSARPVFKWNFGDSEADSQTGFRVELATHSSLLGSSPYGFDGALAHDSGGVTSSTQSYQPGADINSGIYYWHVKTSDTYGAWSVYSSAWQIRLDAAAPAGHSITSVVPQITSCTVNLSAASDPFSGLNALPYSVRYSTSGLFEAEISTVTGWFSGASTDALSMLPGTTYYFAVRARDAVLNEIWSSSYVMPTLADPPGLALSQYYVYAASAVVRWDTKNNSAYTQYRVQRSARDDSAFSVVEGDSQWKTGISSWTFASLETDSTYYFRVKARNPAGLEAPAGADWAAMYSTQTPVNTPLSSAPDIFITSITAHWDANNAPGTSFYVELSTKSDFSAQMSSSGWQGDLTSYTFGGLTPNTSYFIRARGRNSSWAETPDVFLYGEYTRADLPGGTVSAYTRTGSEITVNWGKNGNPYPDTEYYVMRASTQDFSADTGVSGWTSNNSWQFTELAPGTTYYFRVKARNNNAVPYETGWRVLLSSVTNPAPATPTNLTLSYPDADSTDRLTLDWNDNAGTELGYRVYESTDGAVYSLKDTLANNSMTYLMVSLSTNTLYYYKVAAYNTNGESFTNAASTYTRAAQPAAQALSDVSYSSLKANWDGGTNPAWTAYVCDISTKPGFSPLKASSQTALTNASFSSLSSNATHYARVKAVNGSGVETNYTDLGSTVTLPIIITVSAPDLAPGGITQGESVPYAKITVTPSWNNAVWSGLTVNRTGTGSDLDVTRVSLMRDGNSNGAFEAGNDPEVGWGVFASSAVTLSLNETLNSGATYFVVLLVADNYLSWPGNSIGISIVSTAAFVSSNSQFVMTPPAFSSGLSPISKLADTLSALPASVAPFPNVTRGQANTAFLALTLAADRDRAYLRGLTVQKTGNLADSYVSFVKVYLDSDHSGAYNAGDALLSSGVDVFVSSEAAIQFVSPATHTVVNETYFITLDISVSAPLGKTVGVRVADAGAFSLMAGMPDSVSLSVTPADSTLPSVVDPPNVLIVTPASMGVTAVEQGETAALERVEFVTNSGNAVLSGFKVQRSSSSADSDYGMIALYRDNSPFGSFSTVSDSLISSGTFSSGQFTFPLAETITYTSTKAYFVAAGISPSANPSNQAGVLVQSGYITAASGQTTVSAPVPFASDLAVINYTVDTVMVTPDASVAPASVYQGASAVPLLKLGVKTDKNAAGLAGVILNQAGTAADTDISSLRIYKDDGDEAFNAAQDAAVSNAYTFSEGTATISFSSIQSVTVSSGAYFIAANIAGAAVPGRTIRLRLANSSYFSVLAPDLVTSTFPIVSNVVNLEKFPATVLVSTVSLAPASSPAGTADIAMLRLTVRTDQSTAQLASLAATRQGGLDAYVSAVKLFWDANTNGAADVNEFVSSGVFTAGALTLPLPGAAGNQTAASKYYIVTMSLSSSAVINSSVGVGFSGASVPGPDSIEAGRFPVFSGAVVVAEPPSQLAAAFESRLGASVTQGDTAVFVASVTLSASAYSVDWTRLDVLRSGSGGGDADLSALELYADDGDGTWGGLTEETFIASAAFSAGQASFNFAARNITAALPKLFYLAADISNVAAPGAVFGINVPAESYLGVQSPDSVAPSGFAFASSQAVIGATVDTLLAGWQNLSPAVKQGDTKALGKLTLAASANSVSLTDLRFDKTGTLGDAEITGLKLYKDEGDGLFGAGDTLAGSAAGFANGLANIILSPAQEITVVPAVYFAAVDLAQFAAVGTSLGLTASGGNFKVVAPDLVSVTASTVSFSIAGTVSDSSDTVRVTFYDLAPTSLYQGRPGNLMGRLRYLTLGDQAVMTGLKVNLAGTAALSDLGPVKVYADSDSNGVFDPASDVLAASGTFASSVLTLGFAPPRAITLAPSDFFLTLDVQAGANIGATAGLSFPGAGNVVLSGADVVEAFAPLSSGVPAIRDPKIPTPPAVNTVKANGEVSLAEVSYSAYGTRLRFQWTCIVYEGGIDGAYYSIGPSPAVSSSAWTPAGAMTDLTITGLNLTHGSTYYVSLKVKNSLGDYVSDIVSRKFVVDTLKPGVPSAVSVNTEGAAAVVNWGEAPVGPSGLVYYQIEERLGSSPVWNVISTTTERSLSLVKAGSGVSAVQKAAGTYYYRVRAVNGAGVAGEPAQPVTVNLGLEAFPALSMVSVYPNPFDSRKRDATINFMLNQPSAVEITIYDIFGAKVRKISAAGAAGANDVPWDGTGDSGQKVSKGVYTGILKAAGEQVKIRIGVIH